MKRGDFIFAAIIIGSFFVLTNVFSANNDIVINEIGSYPSSTHEWIEIWNKGSESVDLTGWKFWENSTNHGLSVSTTDSIVAPGEYAVISQDGNQFLLDYPGFSGSVFDSSWTSLSESGEEIGLKDEAGNFVEQFTYISAPNYSLEKVNPFLNDYTNTNWKENPNGNSVGFINYNFSTSTASSTEENIPTSTAQVATATIWSNLKINEFLPDPESGNEWVEIFNPSTSSLDIGNGTICDSRNTTSTCKQISGNVSAMSWLFIDLLANSYLNNTGDSVILKNPEGSMVDEVSYATISKGQSFARRADGVDTDNSSDWEVTTQPTPANANIIVTPVSPQQNSGSGGSSPLQSAQPSPIVLSSTTPTLVSSSLIINELFPYPDDSDDEFIEVKNISSSTISLAGWKLADLARQFALSGTINGGEIKIFEKSLIGIALNNSTKEEVKLINPAGAVADKISYEKAVLNQSYSLGEDKKWHWTEAVTPGLENIIKESSVSVITKEENVLAWKIKYQPRIRVGQKTNFDTSKTLDPRGGRFLFGWNLEDKIIYGSNIEYVFSSSGLHSVNISATSTAGTIDHKEIKVMVYPSDISYGAGVIINEISPNPESDDEYIKIKNISSGTVDISNWKLMYNDNIYKIPTSTNILAGDYLVFYKPITKFSLNNTGGALELRLDNDALADSVEFGKSKAGQVYSLINNKWAWIGETENLDAPKKVASSGSAKKIVSIIKADILDARNLAKGQNVITEGVVSVLPGVFGSQFFYISDGFSGIQIYQYKKDFPKLALGDKVKITGIISEASGIKRINFKSKNNISVVSINNSVSVVSSSIDDLNEDILGGLVKISGEITEIKSSFMYVDDGNNEAVVYFKKGTKIDKTKFKEGENVEVIGVLEQSKTGLQVWPRSQDDIKSLGLSEDLLKKQAVLEKSAESDTAEKYLTATAGGITTLLLGFFARARGTAVKKIALAAIGFIRKEKV